MSAAPNVSPELQWLFDNRRTLEQACKDVGAARGCFYCANEAEPGRIETDNNGPIGPCPVCKGLGNG